MKEGVWRRVCGGGCVEESVWRRVRGERQGGESKIRWKQDKGGCEESHNLFYNIPHDLFYNIPHDRLQIAIITPYTINPFIFLLRSLHP